MRSSIYSLSISLNRIASLSKGVKFADLERHYQSAQRCGAAPKAETTEIVRKMSREARKRNHVLSAFSVRWALGIGNPPVEEAHPKRKKCTPK